MNKFFNPTEEQAKKYCVTSCFIVLCCCIFFFLTGIREIMIITLPSFLIGFWFDRKHTKMIKQNGEVK